MKQMEHIGKIKYDEDKILGSGSYGSVFEGFMDGREVAVKQILKNKSANGREEKFLSTHKNLHIIKLFHTEQDTNFVQVICFY